MNWCSETVKMGVSRETRDTSQGPTPEDAREDGHIRGRSSSFMKHPGQVCDDESSSPSGKGGVARFNFV
jgi:hypothetical protein